MWGVSPKMTYRIFKELEINSKLRSTKFWILNVEQCVFLRSNSASQKGLNKKNYDFFIELIWFYILKSWNIFRQVIWNKSETFAFMIYGLLKRLIRAVLSSFTVRSLLRYKTYQYFVRFLIVIFLKLFCWPVKVKNILDDFSDRSLIFFNKDPIRPDVSVSCFCVCLGNNFCL